jgi:hypothetical protein
VRLSPLHCGPWEAAQSGALSPEAFYVIGGAGTFILEDVRHPIHAMKHAISRRSAVLTLASVGGVRTRVSILSSGEAISLSRPIRPAAPPASPWATQQILPGVGIPIHRHFEMRWHNLYSENRVAQVRESRQRARPLVDRRAARSRSVLP